MSTNKNSVKSELLNLPSLSFEQLTQIKQEFEQEMSNIQESLQTLYNCKGKYSFSKESLESIQPELKDQEVLVPLTSSMYVPGRLKDLDNFIIDIGTGYYVERDLENSRDYFKRRIEYLQEQIDSIEKIQIQKSRFLSNLNGVLEMKEVALKQMQQQKQQQTSTG